MQCMDCSRQVGSTHKEKLYAAEYSSPHNRVGSFCEAVWRHSRRTNASRRIVFEDQTRRRDRRDASCETIVVMPKNQHGICIHCSAAMAHAAARCGSLFDWVFALERGPHTNRSHSSVGKGKSRRQITRGCIIASHGSRGFRTASVGAIGGGSPGHRCQSPSTWSLWRSAAVRLVCCRDTFQVADSQQPIAASDLKDHWPKLLLVNYITTLANGISPTLPASAHAKQFYREDTASKQRTYL